MKKLILALGCLVAAAACSITDSDAFQFSFSATPLDAAPTPPAPATINTDTSGLVVVRGDANTPCADQGVRINGNRSGNDLRISINRGSTGACTGGTRWFTYFARMAVPSGGTYHLILTDGTSGSTVTVLDQNVTVRD
ncbi:MAG TPA: hypothetical protein VF092_17840 [Longimicrobium sp.]